MPAQAVGTAVPPFQAKGLCRPGTSVPVNGQKLQPGSRDPAKCPRTPARVLGPCWQDVYGQWRGPMPAT
eukprot:12325464-Karenia_brevis.AAC.1